MEKSTNVTPEQSETAWKIYHLAVNVSCLIMESIFGEDPKSVFYQPIDGPLEESK